MGVLSTGIGAKTTSIAIIKTTPKEAATSLRGLTKSTTEPAKRRKVSMATPNDRPPMPPDDKRHGTTRGYLQGCKCSDCRAAIATYQRRRRKRKEMYGVGYSVDALGSKRRIEALYALGWTSPDVLKASGLSHRNRLFQIREATWLERSTAKRIAGAYRQLCMTLPPDTAGSRRQRAFARNRGWAPPLAWNNIDDPNDQPQGMDGFARPKPRCGTDAAYTAHLRLGEPTCRKCRDAHAATRRKMRGAA